MTKTAHTPGPWEVHGDAIMADPRRHLPDTMLCIATMQDHDGERLASVAAANARLIAAAPELLEALKAIRCHRPDHGDTIWQQVEDAIAKAEARS